MTDESKYGIGIEVNIDNLTSALKEATDAIIKATSVMVSSFDGMTTKVEAGAKKVSKAVNQMESDVEGAGKAMQRDFKLGEIASNEIVASLQEQIDTTAILKKISTDYNISITNLKKALRDVYRAENADIKANMNEAVRSYKLQIQYEEQLIKEREKALVQRERVLQEEQKIRRSLSSAGTHDDTSEGHTKAPISTGVSSKADYTRFGNRLGDYQSDEYKKGIKEATGYFKDLEKSSAQADVAITNTTSKMSALGNVANAVGTTLRYMFAYQAIQWFEQVTVGSIQFAASLEKTQMQFSVLLGNAQAAKQLFGEIQKYAVWSPFQVPNISDGAKKLLAAGFASDEVMPKIKQLGDVAMGDNEKFERLSAAFAKVAMRGKASMRELNQFIYSGVPIVKELAKNLNLTSSEVFDMSRKGKIAYTDVAKALETLTAKGGMFHDMATRQASTLSGLWAVLVDQFNLTSANITNLFLPSLKNAVSGLITFTGNIYNVTSSLKTWIDAHPRLVNGLMDVLKYTALITGAIILLNSGALANLIVNILPELIVKIETFVVTLLPTLIAQLSSLYTMIVTELMTAFVGLLALLGDIGLVLFGMPAMFSKLAVAEGVATAATGVLDAALGLLVGIMEGGILVALAILAAEFIGNFSGIRDYVGVAVNNVIDDVKRLIKGLVEAAKGVARLTKDMVTLQPDNIIGADFSRITDGLNSASQAASDGIMDASDALNRTATKTIENFKKLSNVGKILTPHASALGHVGGGGVQNADTSGKDKKKKIITPFEQAQIAYDKEVADREKTGIILSNADKLELYNKYMNAMLEKHRNYWKNHIQEEQQYSNRKKSLIEGDNKDQLAIQDLKYKEEVLLGIKSQEEQYDSEVKAAVKIMQLAKKVYGEKSVQFEKSCYDLMQIQKKYEDWKNEQVNKISQIELEKAKKTADYEKSLAEESTRHKSAMGNMTDIDVIKEEIAAQQNKNEKVVADYNAAVSKLKTTDKNYYQDLEKLDADKNNDVEQGHLKLVQLNNKLVEAQKSAWTSFKTSLPATFQSGLSSMLAGTSTFVGGMKSIISGINTSFSNMIAKMVVDWITSHATMQAATLAWQGFVTGAHAAVQGSTILTTALNFLLGDSHVAVATEAGIQAGASSGAAVANSAVGASAAIAAPSQGALAGSMGAFAAAATAAIPAILAIDLGIGLIALAFATATTAALSFALATIVVAVAGPLAAIGLLLMAASMAILAPIALLCAPAFLVSAISLASMAISSIVAAGGMAMMTMTTMMAAKAMSVLACAMAASSVAWIPIAGAVLAPIAALATGAAIAGGANLASFAVGAENLPQDMIAQVHKGERIMTNQENSKFTNFLDNADKSTSNSSNVTYSPVINTISSKGLKDVLMEHGATLVKSINNQGRQFNKLKR